MDVLFSSKTDLSQKKQAAQEIIDLGLNKDKSIMFQLHRQLSKVCMDSLLSATVDRELQFLLMKIAVVYCIKPRFKYPQLEDDFKAVDFKSFKKAARPFLDKIDIYHKKNEIVSCFSDKIGIEHENEHLFTCGWVDFNETCLGITSEREDSEIYTEIQYSSLEDWYIVEDSCLCLDMHQHSTCIKITIEGPVKFKIISLLQLKSIKQLKRSEPLKTIDITADERKPLTSAANTLKTSFSAINHFKKWMNKTINGGNELSVVKKRMRKRTAKRIRAFYERALQRHIHVVASSMNELQCIDPVEKKFQVITKLANSNAKSILQMLSQNQKSFITQDSPRGN